MPKLLQIIKPYTKASSVIILGAFSFLTLFSCKKEIPQKTTDWPLSPAVEKAPTPITPQKRKKPTTSTTFICYNLKNYLQMSRSVNGQRQLAGKPEAQINQLVQVISQIQPDILGVSEIGSQDDLIDLQERLKKQGLDLPHHYHTGGSDKLRFLGMLSKYPIISQTKPAISYQMQGQQHFIRRGIADATIRTPSGDIRFIGVHLKSKRPSSLFDQELVRRNEAYTLRKHLEKIHSQAPNQPTLVYGDFNDTRQSLSVRSIIGSNKSDCYYRPLNLKAPNGTKWTHHWQHQDIYSRIDYVMPNRAMSPLIKKKKSAIINVFDSPLASDHRPLKVVFQ